MIKIENLSKYYGQKRALNGLNLHIAKGKIFGLLGPNGAGKTTLISILNGLSDFNEGGIMIDAKPLRENIKAIRKRSALIPQSLAFYENLSVIENLKFFGGIQNIPAARLEENIQNALKINRLNAMLDQKSSTLSGGQKRRLNIAIGLLNDPEILYFDEPTVGIDPESRNEILETIKSFKSMGKTVIYTSHYMNEIEKICDEVAIINAGEIIKQGSIEEMVRQDATTTLVELYESDMQTLEMLASKHELLEVIDMTSLSFASQKPEDIEALVRLLEEEGVKFKSLDFATTTLEKLFIALTSKGRQDV